ncbi:MAG: histidinol-phosphate transaminase [Candidatus Omnitrophota bacterium]
MKNIIRKDILNIEAYQPGKPIEEVKRELGIKDVIKLASNENALGPSPKALRAIAKITQSLHRYPQGDCFYLKQALARYLKISSAHLMFGNGSDELIDVILKTIHAPNAQIITADCTFVEYKISAAINRFKVKTVPLIDFKFDLDGIKKAVTKNTKAIFIANPNNPTGTYVNKNEIIAFIKSIPKNILIVFDEAYFEYVQTKDFPDLIPIIKKHNNIVILRTFSKIFGLAGLRVGYMICSKGFIKAAERVRQPFNVNTLAQIAAQEALGDLAFLRKTQKLVNIEKRFLYAEFKKLNLWFQPSETNFIFIKMNCDVSHIFHKMLKKGVIIRPMSSCKLHHYCRITIGTHEENKKLIRILKSVLQETNK